MFTNLFMDSIDLVTNICNEILNDSNICLRLESIRKFVTNFELAEIAVYLLLCKELEPHAARYVAAHFITKETSYKLSELLEEYYEET